MTNNYKIFIVAVFTILSIKLKAQIPNAGFENWSSAGFPSYLEPDNWGTLNSSTAIIQTFTTERANTANAHSGTYAIKLSSHYIAFAGQTAPGITVSNATINTSTQAVNGGFAYTQRPTHLKGWFKGTPAANDSSSIELILWKWISGVKTTIGTATFYNSRTVANYTMFTAAINYTNAANPDSALITMSSSDTNRPVDGSVFYVDDLELIDCSAFTASASSTNTICTANSGTVTVTATGATSYLWSNSANTSTINSLAAGPYTVTVQNANGCSATASTSVSRTTTAINSNATSTNTTCTNVSGSATVTPTNGTAPYSYLWSVNSANTATVMDLDAGTYQVTVTDANGCTGTAATTVNRTTYTITSTISSTPTSCSSNTGTATVVATSGVPNYNYLWSNQEINPTITNLAAGAYTVTITDPNGCTGTATTSVTTPNGPSATYLVTSVICNGGNSGAVAVTTTGGTAPISYNWSNSETTEDIDTLIAGTYSLTISDDNNCSFTLTAVVNQVSAVNLSATNVDVSCFGGNNGSIDLTATGGTPGYEYLWSNAAVTEDISGLTAGTYSVNVKDDNGCTASYSYTVDEPSVLSASATATNVSCFGATTGSAEFTVTGGTGPYSYTWTNSVSTTSAANSLAAGIYTITATDDNGCTVTASATISEPTALATGALTITDASSATASDGSITLSPSGGTPTYTYTWSSGNGTNLTPGNYCVTVTDANSCTANACGNVSAPTGITNLNNTKVQVYPNPANSLLTVETRDINEKFNCTIYTVEGKLLMEKIVTGNKTTINIDDLPAGFYTLQLNNLATQVISNTKLQVIK